MTLDEFNAFAHNITWVALVATGAITIVSLCAYSAFHSVLKIIEYFLLHKKLTKYFIAFLELYKKGRK